MNKISEIIKIADTHAARIQMALEDLKTLIPFDALKIRNHSAKLL